MTRGQRIKSKREELNISLTDFSKKVNVSKQTLYKYENDIVTNIPYDKIVEISNALDVTPGYLMGWEDTENSTAASETLINLYIKNEQDREFMELYHKASPELRQAVLAALKSATQDS